MRFSLLPVLALSGLAACQSHSPVAGTPAASARPAAPSLAELAAIAATELALEPGQRVVYADGSDPVRSEDIEENANTMRALISVPGMT
ncbi:MAG TPA: hypothetical protein VGC54_00105 [Planctomycetota bacterium]